MSRGEKQCSHNTARPLHRTKKSSTKGWKNVDEEDRRFHRGGTTGLRPERISLDKVDGGKGILLRMNQFSLLLSTLSHRY